MLKLRFGKLNDKLNDISTIVFLHFAIFSIGLIHLTWVISRYLYLHMYLQKAIDQACGWISSFPHGKLPQLLHCVLSLGALGVFYALYFFTIFCIKKQGNLTLRVDKGVYVVFYFIFIGFVNIGFFAFKLFPYVTSLLWCLCFLSIPAFYCMPIVKEGLHLVNAKHSVSKGQWWLVTTLVSVVFCLFFYPLMVKSLLIENDFIDIPEQTILSPDHVVDNTRYINQYRLGGLMVYDPRIDRGVLPKSADIMQIGLPSNDMLSYFLSRPAHNIYIYDTEAHILSLKGAMTKKDYEILLAIYRNDAKSQQVISQLFSRSVRSAEFYKTKIYTAEEESFLRKNRIELEHKIQAGWFFFHHSWVLNPILALAAGADSSHQVLIYGWGSAVFLKELLLQLGGINFHNYFKVFFAFYPLYFLFFIAAVFAVFRRIDFVGAAALLLSATVFLLGDQIIRLAPGYNPMRHMFDVVVVVLFFLYAKRDSLLTLLFCLLMSLVSVVWSKDFGLFLLVSVAVTGVIKNIFAEKMSYGQLGLIFLSAIIGLCIYFYPSQGVNYNLIYMLLGYTIPGTSTALICSWLFAIGGVYLMSIKFKNIHSPFYWLSLFLFFYAQLQLIYYFWHPSYQHLLVCAPTFILLGLSWWHRYSLSQLSMHKKEILGISMVSFVILIFIYLVTLIPFYLSRVTYNKIFSTHVVYDWTSKQATFRSTMDPQLFEESVQLIHKYEPHQGMYLISKYDAILPVLADRYEALPVVNLALDLISYRDLARCEQALKAAKPAYIFVDTDITRDLRGDLLAKADRNYGESYGRYSAILNMRQFFYKIQDEYQPVDVGRLITVYQRKHDV